MKISRILLSMMVACTATTATIDAQAAKSSVNIMSPRNTVKVSKDYTYGYNYLPGDALDVYETANRRIGWTINYDYLDTYFLRPVSVAYVDYIPEGIRTCLHNIEQNIREPNNIVNNALAGEFKDSGISTLRFVINSTVGICGCFDVAQYLELERKRMTFSTTLGKWGVKQGGYLNVPFLGVYTYRDVFGSIVDVLYYPYNHIPLWGKIGLWAHSGVDKRSALLDQDDVLRNSVDPYIQARDFYLMYQESLVSGKEAMASQPENTEDLDQYMDEID